MHARKHTRASRCWAALALLAASVCGRSARAEPPPRELVFGIAPHLRTSLSQSCQRGGDVVECQDLNPFAGADVSLHFWPIDLLGLGARIAVSTDLDAAEGASSEGITWDPEDQWLWRFVADARLDPPLLPEGLWFGAEAGLALLVETQQSLQDTRVVEDSATRVAPLLGLAIGWDFWLGRSITLTPELRAELIAFGDPPELRADVEGRDYGASTWLELALRFGYVF